METDKYVQVMLQGKWSKPITEAELKRLFRAGKVPDYANCRLEDGSTKTVADVLEVVPDNEPEFPIGDLAAAIDQIAPHSRTETEMSTPVQRRSVSTQPASTPEAGNRLERFVANASGFIVFWSVLSFLAFACLAFLSLPPLLAVFASLLQIVFLSIHLYFLYGIGLVLRLHIAMEQHQIKSVKHLEIIARALNSESETV